MVTEKDRCDGQEHCSKGGGQCARYRGIARMEKNRQMTQIKGIKIMEKVKKCENMHTIKYEKIF